MPAVGETGKRIVVRKPPKKKTPKPVVRNADTGDRARSRPEPEPTKVRQYAHPQRKNTQKVFRAQEREARAATRKQTQAATKARVLKQDVSRLKVTPVPSPDARDTLRSPAQKSRDTAVVAANIRTARQTFVRKRKHAQGKALLTGDPVKDPRYRATPPKGYRYDDAGKLRSIDPDKWKKDIKRRELQRAERVAPVVDILEETTRPLHAVAAAAKHDVQQVKKHGITGAVGHGSLGAAKRGIQNKDKSTFADVFTEAGWKPKGTLGKVAKGVTSFGADVIFDPTTLTTGGTTSVARKAAITAARKAERGAVRSAGAQVAREKATQHAVKQGATPKAAKAAGKQAVRVHARRAGKAAGEAAKVDKPTNTGLTIRFGGRDIPAITRATSAAKRGPRAVARKTGLERTRAGAKVDRAQQRVRDASRNFASDFNPAIAPAGVDRELYQAARRSARTARAGAQRGTFRAGQRAIAFRKAIGPANYTKVIDAIETGTISELPKELRGPARELQQDFTKMRKAELRAGLKVGEKKIGGRSETYVKHLRLKPEEPVRRGPPQVASMKPRPSFAKGRKEGTLAEKNVAEPGAYSEDIAELYVNRGAESAVSISKARLNQAMVHAGHKPDRSVPIKKQLADNEALYKVEGADLIKIDPKSTEAKTLPKDGKYVILNEKLISRTRGTVGAAAERSTAGVVFDKAQGVWKLTATQVNPGYHVRNLAGEAQNAYLAENSIILGRNAFQAARALRQLGRDEEALRVLGKKGPGREPTTKRTVTETTEKVVTKTEPIDEATRVAAAKAIQRHERKQGRKATSDEKRAIRRDAAKQASKYDPTPEGIAARTFYHGTGTKGMSPEHLDSMGTNIENLFGQGVYLTTKPGIARGYSKARGRRTKTSTIYEARVNPKKVLDLEAPVDPKFLTILEKNAESMGYAPYEGMTDEIVEAVREAAAKPGATNESVFDAMRRAVGDHSHTYEKSRSEYSENFQDLVSDLRGAGWDAMTHIGGKRTGRDPHQVVIVLDPSDMSGLGKANPVTKFEDRIAPPPRAQGPQNLPLGRVPTSRETTSAVTETTTRTIKQRGARKPDKRYAGINITEAENVGAVRAGQLGREVGEMLGSASKKSGPVKVRRGVLRKPARALKNVEDVFRLASYKGGLDRGLTPEKAMERASRFHFDYGDLTPLERTVLRRAFPFWTFSSRNIPLQARALLTTPGKYANYQKVRENFQKAFGVPDDWEKDVSPSEQRSAAIPVKINGKTYGISLGPSGLPLTDLNEFPTTGDPVKQADEWINRGMSMLTPGAKTPVEIWSNLSFFFRAPIEKDTGSLVPAPAWVQYIPEKYRKELGITDKYRNKQTGKSGWGAPAKLVYALGILPGPIAFANRMMTQSDKPGQTKAGQAVQYVGPRVRQTDPVGVRINQLFAERAKLTKDIETLEQTNHPDGTAVTRMNPTQEYRRLYIQRKKVEADLLRKRVQRGDKGLIKPRRGNSELDVELPNLKTETIVP